jgi:hypothetical protein
MTNDNLPPLPEPIANGSYTSCHDCQRYNAPIYSPEQMREYARAAVAAALAQQATGEPVGYFLRNGWCRDGVTQQWAQVADEFKNDADVVPLYLAPGVSQEVVRAVATPQVAYSRRGR